METLRRFSAARTPSFQPILAGPATECLREGSCTPPIPFSPTLRAKAGAPVSLQALGLPGDAIDRAADLALSNPYWNPRPLDRGGIRALLEDAWHGRHPRSTTAS